jgi:hypothetical protein
MVSGMQENFANMQQCGSRQQLSMQMDELQLQLQVSSTLLVLSSLSC